MSIFQSVEKQNGNYWIGLQKFEDEFWKWRDGTALNITPRWDTNEPSVEKDYDYAILRLGTDIYFAIFSNLNSIKRSRNQNYPFFSKSKHLIAFPDKRRKS